MWTNLHITLREVRTITPYHHREDKIVMQHPRGLDRWKHTSSSSTCEHRVASRRVWSFRSTSSYNLRDEQAVKDSGENSGIAIILGGGGA